MFGVALFIKVRLLMVTDDEHVLGRGGHWQNSDALIGSFTVLVW